MNTRKPDQTPSRRNWAQALERGGFLRSVAGDEDFAAAEHAFDLMSTSGKGIIVTGEYGVGKTQLARAIIANMTRPPVCVTLTDTVDTDKLSKEWIRNYRLYSRSVFLDDLGAEKPTNEYGVITDPAADFIVNYHAHWNGASLIIITTNLTTDEIDARYGGRVLSRLKDLCVPLHLTGEDKRKWER